MGSRKESILYIEDFGRYPLYFGRLGIAGWGGTLDSQFGNHQTGHCGHDIGACLVRILIIYNVLLTCTCIKSKNHQTRIGVFTGEFKQETKQWPTAQAEGSVEHVDSEQGDLDQKPS
jgi:hypothetical protein